MDYPFNQSIELRDDTITPFIPFIFQDIWSLGGNPAATLFMVAKHISPTSESHFLDLGCGKGATLLELAATFPGRYTGVDMMAAFIEEGRLKIDRNQLSDRVFLKNEDIPNTLSDGAVYDVVLYGHDSDLVGSAAQTLFVLKRKIKTGGRIIYETAFHDGRYMGNDYLSEPALYAQIESSGARVVDALPWGKDFIREQNAANNRLIKKRIDDLKNRDERLGALLDAFYFNQIQESGILDEYIECVTFLMA